MDELLAILEPIQEVAEQKHDGGPASYMTLRQHYAGIALAALIARNVSEPEYMASQAVEFSDALIAEEAKSSMLDKPVTP